MDPAATLSARRPHEPLPFEADPEPILRGIQSRGYFTLESGSSLSVRDVSMRTLQLASRFPPLLHDVRGREMRRKTIRKIARFTQQSFI